MPTLISPGVSVSIIDESFFVPGTINTVPLIVIATAERKTQEDGVTPALGTYESGVVRTVTSATQALQLYGVPKYYTDANGNPHHGDARNEYGLDALIKYLEIANRAYVIRANVNLDDTYESVKELWNISIADSADFLNELVNQYIVEYNNSNNFVPADVGYKLTVTATELKTLLDEALDSTLSLYSFSSNAFIDAFIEDHQVDHPAYQEVEYDSSAGYIQLTDITGLENDTTSYAFEVTITDTGGTNTVQVVLAGENAQTFDELITEVQTQIQAVTGDTGTVVELIQGNIRITSGLAGATSSVSIVNDGASGHLPLFANTNLFVQILPEVEGKGVQSLTVYDDAFTTVVGSYEGLNWLIDNFTAGSIVSDEFTGQDAEGLLLSAASTFDNTQEFLGETSLGANDAARRVAIVKQLQAVINDPNSNIRNESIEYATVVTPGYPETSDEMLRLSADLLNEVFVIGETPFDRVPTGPNGMVEWATSPAKSTSRDIAYYYPHGISSNVDGAQILTSAASTALRTFAVNDRDGELWTAPAGTDRGLCPHLETIGYVTGNLGTATTFTENFIDVGLRDTLYEEPKKINPITFLPGRGILVLGQKTTSPDVSSLESVNVSRLVKYIKRAMRKVLFSFLFQPNTSTTRANVASTVNNFLSGLLEREALYDFAVKCDDDNNTDDRIQRKELWVDIALKPVLAIEFIYVPIRVVDTGADI